MNETKKKKERRPSLKERLRQEDRCIYCFERPDTVEHMPPIWAFSKRQRPQGLEFASCETCNNGTKGADMATGWFARIRPFHGDNADLLLIEAKQRVHSLDQLVPGLREEVFDLSHYETFQMDADGQTHELIRIVANGPLLAGTLTTFGAKLGMALYREHIGEPLPKGGAVFVQPYLNGGLNQKSADAILSILPARNTLRNGRKQVSDQFSYAYNCDEKSIIMALASFHKNLHFQVLATSTPDIYEEAVRGWFVARVAPGELLEPRNLFSLDPRNARTKYILTGLPRPS